MLSPRMDPEEMQQRIDSLEQELTCSVRLVALQERERIYHYRMSLLKQAASLRPSGGAPTFDLDFDLYRTACSSIEDEVKHFEDSTWCANPRAYEVHLKLLKLEALRQQVDQHTAEKACIHASHPAHPALSGRPSRVSAASLLPPLAQAQVPALPNLCLTTSTSRLRSSTMSSHHPVHNQSPRSNTSMGCYSTESSRARTSMTHYAMDIPTAHASTNAGNYPTASLMPSAQTCTGHRSTNSFNSRARTSIGHYPSAPSNPHASFQTVLITGQNTQPPRCTSAGYTRALTGGSCLETVGLDTYNLCSWDAKSPSSPHHVSAQRPAKPVRQAQSSDCHPEVHTAKLARGFQLVLDHVNQSDKVNTSNTTRSDMTSRWSHINRSDQMSHQPSLPSSRSTASYQSGLTGGTDISSGSQKSKWHLCKAATQQSDGMVCQYRGRWPRREYRWLTRQQYEDSLMEQEGIQPRYNKSGRRSSIALVRKFLGIAK